MSLISMIIQIKVKDMDIWTVTALDMAKLTTIAYFCSMIMGKIDFENLLVLEKAA